MPTKYKISEKEIAEINKRFTYHAPKEDQPVRYTEIRDAIKLIALGLCQQCPDSTERSTALIHLEEAVFWANAAIARNE